VTIFAPIIVALIIFTLMVAATIIMMAVISLLSQTPIPIDFGLGLCGEAKA
jgi:hypothetical protein